MEKKPASTDPFAFFWLTKLSAEERKKRIELAFIPIKESANAQITLLKKYENSNFNKEIGFKYFTVTVKNAWDNIDFAIEIGKSSFMQFSYYPTRTVLESLLRLEYYCFQNKDGQNDIALREILRIAKRFYDREKIDNGTGEPYKTIYTDIASQGSYPPIEKANPKDDPFPNIRKLTEETPAYEKNCHLYFTYEALCELSHGKMMAIGNANEDGLAEHVRSLMGLFSYSCNLLRLTDHHIQGATAPEVEKAINIAENIIKEGM